MSEYEEDVVVFRAEMCWTTVVGDNINIMKTTFELNFDFYQALNSMDTQNYGNKDKLSI